MSNTYKSINEITFMNLFPLKKGNALLPPWLLVVRGCFASLEDSIPNWFIAPNNPKRYQAKTTYIMLNLLKTTYVGLGHRK